MEDHATDAPGPAGPQPIAGVVYFGASLPIRALQMLLFKAAALFGVKTPFQPTYCANEADAFAWVEARRRELG